jgi:hypothetical protein
MVLDDGFPVPARQERLRLSAKVPVGCVVHTRKALPAVLPAFRPDTSGDRGDRPRRTRTAVADRPALGTQGVAAGPEFDARAG